MRQAEKERKKFQSRILFQPDPGQKIPKKVEKNSRNQKTSFQHYFYPNRFEIGPGREKKILVPNSVPTRPGQEISKKKRKKVQKLKKYHSGIISIQNRLREVEKEIKKIQSPIPFILNPGKKIPKKFAKKFKKLKNLFPSLFLAKMG